MTVWDNPAERQAKWIADGHDSQCEQRERSFICHCDKRQRESRGLTDLPTEDLYFPSPDCPVCYGGLEHDDDGWDCQRCHISWNSDGRGSSANFTDDMGTGWGGEQFGSLMHDLVNGRSA